MSAYMITPSTFAHCALRLTLQRISRLRTGAQIGTSASPYNNLSSSRRTTHPNLDRAYSTKPRPISGPDPHSRSTDILPRITPRILSRTELHRLHRLSALNPPPPDSDEEAILLRELGELVGLMDLVKDVELPDMQGDVGRLLSEGVGSVELDLVDDSAWRAGGVGVEEGVEASAREVERGETGEGMGMAGGTKQGRELLEYGTRRVGDYYASRTGKRKE